MLSHSLAISFTVNEYTRQNETMLWATSARKTEMIMQYSSIEMEIR